MGDRSVPLVHPSPGNLIGTGWNGRRREVQRHLAREAGNPYNPVMIDPQTCNVIPCATVIEEMLPLMPPQLTWLNLTQDQFSRPPSMMYSPSGEMAKRYDLR